MSLEERVTSTLKEAGDRITPREPSPVRHRVPPPSSRRLRHPIAAFLAGALAVLILGAVALLAGPFDPNAIDPATTHDVETVEIADLAVTVVDTEPARENPSVWIGRPGPSPQFDTSRLGPDLSFARGEPGPEDLDDQVTRAVYIGELDDEPFYIYAQRAPSIFDWFSEVIFGNFSGQVMGTSLSCCTGGDMDREGGFAGVSGSQTGNEQPVIIAEWLGLSPDVSVVAYQFDGEFVGWQIPVGGVSSIHPAVIPGEYVLIAYDANGREVDRSGPYSGPVFGDTASISLILTRDGVEIRPEDIPTEDLRNLIDLRPTDRVFAVPNGEFQVYVVVSEVGRPHVYATSCDVLESAGMLGWSGACLERTVDGQREIGVFPYEPDRG